MVNKHPKEVATFIDRYGDEQLIHRVKHRSNQLAVKRRRTTPVMTANPVIGRLMGEKITARRKKKGWTLAQCAVAAGLVAGDPKSRMWEIEKGAYKEGVRFGTLFVLAVALECELADLLPTVEEIVATGEVNFSDVPTEVPTLAARIKELTPDA